jgi:hypothetical protein
VSSFHYAMKVILPVTTKIEGWIGVSKAHKKATETAKIQCKERERRSRQPKIIDTYCN